MSNEIDTVFELGQKVHVYNECGDYIGFDGVIERLEEVYEGEEFYLVEMPNGAREVYSEMQLGEIG